MFKKTADLVAVGTPYDLHLNDDHHNGGGAHPDNIQREVAESVEDDYNNQHFYKLKNYDKFDESDHLDFDDGDKNGHDTFCFAFNNQHFYKVKKMMSLMILIMTTKMTI